MKERFLRNLLQYKVNKIILEICPHFHKNKKQRNMIKEENRIYTVKQGDTLQSIADHLQINVDDIVEFHNRHSNTFITEYRPNLFGVDNIILPADLSEFRRRHNPNRLNLLYGDITLACEDIVIDEATELEMRGQNAVATFDAEFNSGTNHTAFFRKTRRKRWSCYQYHWLQGNYQATDISRVQTIGRYHFFPWTTTLSSCLRD